MKINRISSWFAGMIIVMLLIAAPLATNADYDACMTSCLDDGHSHNDCSDACSD